MAFWKVSTIQKKSCEEREIWSKGNKSIIRINGFRWGTFTLETTDDNPPDGITEENKEGINIYDYTGSNLKSITLDSMDDGWLGDCELSDNIDEDEQAELLEGMEDDYYEYLETNGWVNDETEVWLFGPLEITKID
jgi:hypothetical protein